MCHAEFVYKPINRINFISGANGSGKSAVLAALQFALGGNARLANRGTTNKNFIRTNQPNASVEVALFNKGENAYKPVSDIFYQENEFQYKKKQVKIEEDARNEG